MCIRDRALAVGDRSSTIGSSKDADNLTRRPRTAIATVRRLRNFSRCLAAIRTFGPRPTRRCDIKARDLMSQIHQAAQKPISENATAKRKTRVPDRLNNWQVCGSDSVKLRYVFPKWRFLEPKDAPYSSRLRLTNMNGQTNVGQPLHAHAN